MSKENLEMENILKIDKIFEKIINKYEEKMKSNKYILNFSLQNYLYNPETPIFEREKIEEGAFFVIKRPLCYLELIDNKNENNNYENNNGNNINNLDKAETSGNNNGNKINNINNINNGKNENKYYNNENDKINKGNKINNGNNLNNGDKAESLINEIDKGNKVNDENNNVENKNNINNINNNDNNNINNDNNINENNRNNINENNRNNINENNRNNINKKIIDIQFLVKAKFKDDDKKEISFWVCSLKYLKEQLMNLGYKEAKIMKKKKILFSEDEEQENKDKESSSESFDDRNINLDIELIENEVKVSKNPFNIENIFNNAQNVFNPLINMDNIKDYLYDLNLPKEKYEKLILNEKYFNYLMGIWEINHKNNFYCYNQISGVTLSLLQILEQKREVYGTRYFHFNSEKIDKYKKNYFYFKLAKLFKKDEKELYTKIIKSKSEGIINHDIKYMTDILIEVLKKFENIFIIFDNIKNNYIFTRVNQIIDDLKIQKDVKKFTSLMFIQINSSTIRSIENIDYFSMILPIESSYKAELPLKEYVNHLLIGNENDKNIYIEKYKKNIEKIILDIKEDSIDYLVFLIKLLYKGSFKENNNFLDYNAYDYLIKFLPFLFIFLCHKYYNKLTINKIEYRVGIIKEIISNQVNLLLSQKMLSDEVFSLIKTKSTEGIYIEKEIIYFLITENIGFDKIKIEKIYCFNSNLEKKIKNNEIIFIQELETSPLYDFGIIIIIDGEPIFKGYQIGINKPRQSLLNLSKNKIKMDILYFISKINKFLPQKITKFSFGIITTINAYYAQNNKENKNIDENDNDNDNYFINEDKKEEENDNEYKNFEIMKNFCNANNYEFIIFSPKDKRFYVNEGDNLKNIAFNKYFNPKLANNFGNYIFSNENNLNLNKLPLNPNEITKKDKESIFNYVKEIKNKQLIFIGKFEKETNNKNEIIEKVHNNNFNDLIDNNYLIYAKDKNKKKMIFFNKKYFCNDLQNLKIFYVFDTSLDINKRGRKKKNNDLENIIIDSNLNLKPNEELLKKKRKRKLNEKNEEGKEKGEEEEEEGEESKNSDM